MKKIWLVNYYAMPPEFESRLRTIKFAKYLTNLGYTVTIISSSFMHNMNINLIEDKAKFMYKNYDGLDFIHIRTIGYRKNGLLRILSLFEFHIKLLLYGKKFIKPDVIVHTVLPPFGNILYYLAKRMRTKYIVEVLDLWPDSFVDMKLISTKNPLLKLLYFLERWIYKRADSIVFSMEGGKDYILDKKWDLQIHNGKIDLNKIYYINNGVDLQDFNYNLGHCQLQDSDLLDDNIKRIIYIGSIRLANNLKYLISAAEHLLPNKNIKFLLYGDGDDRQYLEDYCNKRNITNVIFKEKWINPQYVPFLLSKSNVNILNYAKGFGKYGGSQSKLFQYLASGNPICSNLDMPYCPIKKYGLGISRDFISSKDYSLAILELLELSDEQLKEIKDKASRLVQEFDYKTLTTKLINVF